VKELLIIQQDEAYFLFETFQFLERFKETFKTFKLTLLVDPNSLKQLEDGSCSYSFMVTSNVEQVFANEYDASVNLSLNDFSWDIHGKVKSLNKLGPYKQNDVLFIEDAWSSYYLTLKAGAPFLTFHLTDIFKNIFGIKGVTSQKKEKAYFNQIAFTPSNTKIISGHEQANIIQLLSTRYPQIKIVDTSEVDIISDLSHILYVGPASLDSLKICEAGATGIFLASQFQGFNILPKGESHLFVSARDLHFTAEDLFKLIESKIEQKEIPKNIKYPVYQSDEENVFGGYLNCLTKTCDDNYPIYQSHVVLWNFLLNMFDVNLSITEISKNQSDLLKLQKDTLVKIIRLYDYAMSSIDTIHQEAKSASANSCLIQENLKNLKEIEEISDKISQSHVFLRPILDYYRIRKGQNLGSNLLEQSQHSFLTYSEEHQALKALLELFTVTLNKNEASI
jgi:hypothetical protein